MAVVAEASWLHSMTLPLGSTIRNPHITTRSSFNYPFKLDHNITCFSPSSMLESSPNQSLRYLFIPDSMRRLNLTPISYQSLCAYAYLPLLGDDGRSAFIRHCTIWWLLLTSLTFRIVTDEQKRLPVASSLVGSYRSAGVEESIHVNSAYHDHCRLSHWYLSLPITVAG